MRGFLILLWPVTESTNQIHGVALKYVILCYIILADTRVNHTGVLAVGNYLGLSLAVGILTFVLNSLYGFNYAKINLFN